MCCALRRLYLGRNKEMSKNNNRSETFSLCYFINRISVHFPKCFLIFPDLSSTVNYFSFLFHFLKGGCRSAEVWRTCLGEHSTLVSSSSSSTASSSVKPGGKLLPLAPPSLKEPPDKTNEKLGLELIS